MQLKLREKNGDAGMHLYIYSRAVFYYLLIIHPLMRSQSVRWHNATAKICWFNCPSFFWQNSILEILSEKKWAQLQLTDNEYT